MKGSHVDTWGLCGSFLFCVKGSCVEIWDLCGHLAFVWSRAGWERRAPAQVGGSWGGRAGIMSWESQAGWSPDRSCKENGSLISVGQGAGQSWARWPQAGVTHPCARCLPRLWLGAVRGSCDGFILLPYPEAALHFLQIPTS